jgi:hypothetical protein
MTKRDVLLFRGAPMLVLAVSLVAAFAIELSRRGLPDLGLSVIVAVAFVGLLIHNGVGYLRGGEADYSRGEAMARGAFDLAFATFIVAYSLR